MARIENPMDTKTYDELVSILDSNTQLEDDIKAQMLLLIIEFYKRFPNVPLDNFYERLKGVNISGGSKYLYNTAIQYFPSINEIIINKEMLSRDETDVYHSMMKAILSMIAAKDNYYGFAGNKDLEALNTGFCDMAARALIGNEGISDYEQELEIVDFIGKRIGVDAFVNAFFTNNPSLVLNPMLNLCQSPDKLKAFLNQINNSMYTRKNSNEGLTMKLESEMRALFGNIDFEAAKRPLTFDSESKLK